MARTDGIRLHPTPTAYQRLVSFNTAINWLLRTIYLSIYLICYARSPVAARFPSPNSGAQKLKPLNHARMDLFKKILTPGKPEAGDPGTPAAPPTQRPATDTPSTPTRERVASQDDVVQVCSSWPLSRGHCP
jgi:hypothetical protein